ncbi:MAG: ATP-binding protein [Deltaproteobacteria bacterium]|mgnify:CR=1 FL=1
MTNEKEYQALSAKLLTMMVLRAVLALSFLGITTWFQISEYSFSKFNLYPLYAVVVVVSLLTILYSTLLRKIKNLYLFAYMQVAADIVLITGIVYITGGAESYLHIFYPLSVIGAAIVLHTRGGLFAASASSIAYGVLTALDFYGWLPDAYKVFDAPGRPAWEDVVSTVSTNILAFFTVAYLTGQLALRVARIEKKLTEKEMDFDRLATLNKHIIDNITSGIMTLDERLRITSFNMEAESVTGYSLRELYLKPVDEIFNDMIDAGGLGMPSGTRIEKRFKRKDDSDVYLGYTISHGQGGDVSRIVIFQDLTELRAMEEQLRRHERLKALGELSVGIAHEIRNPLASISGSIHVLKDELKLSGDNLHLMEIVLRETRRLNSLIGDFLLFARPAQNKRETVNLSSIIEETLKVFKNSPDASRIDIETDIKDSVYINGDSRQLGQVFWNLFINAAHAMKTGGMLRISSRLVYPAHGASSGNSRNINGNMALAQESAVEIVVSDTGEGIRPDDIQRIFDPFFSTKDTGTGLGLAIVHRIIESHAGIIEAISRPSGGALFKITLPLSAVKAL